MFKLLAVQGVTGEISAGDFPACPGGNCPAVCKRDDGKLVIVGKKMNESETRSFLDSGVAGIGDDEFAIVIDAKLWTTANEYL